MNPVALIRMISQAPVAPETSQYISIMATNQSRPHVGFAIDTSDVVAAKCLLAMIDDDKHLADLSNKMIHHVTMSLLHLVQEAAIDGKVEKFLDFVGYEGNHQATCIAQHIARTLQELNVCPGEWIEVIYRIAWINGFVSRFQAGMKMLNDTEEAFQGAEDKHLLPGVMFSRN